MPKKVKRVIVSSKVKTNHEARIVIVGGGFGGVAAAQAFLKEDVPHATITLIDKNSYHSLPFDFYETATAFLKERKGAGSGKEAYHNVQSSAAVPFSLIFPRNAVRLIQARVTGVDFEDKKVLLEHNFPPDIPYDYLILALGSETNFFNIPHLGERAVTLKSVNDALNVRNRVDELFAATAKGDPIRIIVGGGGYTGCELAAELVGYCRKLSRIHGHPWNNVEFSLVEAGPSIIGAASPWLRTKAEKRLKRLGVRVYTKSRITDVTPDFISIEGGQEAPYTLLIWTAGVKGNCIVEDIPTLQLEKQSCIAVDRYFNIKDMENAFAIGDIAFYEMGTSKSGLPQTAQVAIREGAYVGRRIAGLLRNQKIPRFKPVYPKFIVPLGEKYTLADLGWLKLAGFPAWMLKRLVSLRYLLHLVPWSTALRIWWKSTALYTKND